MRFLHRVKGDMITLAALFELAVDTFFVAVTDAFLRLLSRKAA